MRLVHIASFATSSLVLVLNCSVKELTTLATADCNGRHGGISKLQCKSGEAVVCPFSVSEIPYFKLCTCWSCRYAPPPPPPPLLHPYDRTTNLHFGELRSLHFPCCIPSQHLSTPLVPATAYGRCDMSQPNFVPTYLYQSRFGWGGIQPRHVVLHARGGCTIKGVSGHQRSRSGVYQDVLHSLLDAEIPPMDSDNRGLISIASNVQYILKLSYCISRRYVRTLTCLHMHACHRAQTSRPDMHPCLCVYSPA